MSMSYIFIYIYIYIYIYLVKEKTICDSDKKAVQSTSPQFSVIFFIKGSNVYLLKNSIGNFVVIIDQRVWRVYLR